MITYADHTFQTHQLQLRDGKSPCHISENLVLIKKIWCKNTDIRVASTHVGFYICNIFTRISIQATCISNSGPPEYSRAPPQKFLRNELNKPMKQGNIHGLLSIKINDCLILFYLRIEHYQLMWIVVNQYRFSLMKIDTGLTQVTHDILYSNVSQRPGRSPVPGPGINYTGPRDVLLEIFILIF